MDALQKAYTEITGKNSGCKHLDDLIAKCIMSKKCHEFMPYFTKYAKDSKKGIDIFQGQLTSKKYFIGYPRKDWTYSLWHVPNPSLLSVLICYRPDKLKFVLDYWAVFYYTLEDVIKNILNTFAEFGYLSMKNVDLDYNSKGMKMIIKFCTQIDVIDLINKIDPYHLAYSGIESGKLNSWNCNPHFYNYLINNFDTKHKYIVEYPYIFLEKYVELNENIDEKIQAYKLRADELDTRGKKGFSLLMMKALKLKNYDYYLYLYKLGYRCFEYGSGLFDIHNKEVFKLAEKITAKAMFTGISRYLCRGKISLETCMLAIHKHKITDFIEYARSEIDDTFYLNIDYSIFHTLYCKLKLAYGNGIIKTLTDVVKYLSIEHLPVIDSSPKIWKQNFVMIIRLPNSYNMLLLQNSL